MDKDIQDKLDAIYKSVEQTRKYFMWTLILSLIFFILPIIGLAIIIPMFWDALTLGNIGGL